jgi:glycosyltransferase involved in cell wall biosynthesis
VRVVFLLPRFSASPVGGFKVVYDYAAYMLGQGVDVQVWHLSEVAESWRQGPARELLRRATGAATISGRANWHPLLQTGAVSVTNQLRPRALNQVDRVVATSWETAEILARKRVDLSKDTYFIQSYESWSGPVNRVDATWRLPMRRIVIANWLLEKARQMNVEAVHVPNAIDLSTFALTQPLDAPARCEVGMLWHPARVKGSDVGLAALQAVRERRAVDVVLLSAHARLKAVPKWITWLQAPSSEQLVEYYNSCKVFVSPSRMEGWALPPAEAMACGAALVSTDIGGVADYAKHDLTALLSPPEDGAALAAAVLSLLANNDRRLEVAARGHSLIRDKFSGSLSAAAFQAAVLS